MSKRVLGLTYSLINIVVQTILYRDAVCMVHPQGPLTIL